MKPAPAPAPAPAPPGHKLRIRPPNAVPHGETRAEARDRQEKDGPWYRLRGAASVETDRFLLRAEEIDYNEQTQYVEARGNVYLQHFEGGEELWAERVEYDIREESGRFYQVRGTTPVQIEARPGILTSSNPYYFEARWAEKIKDKYILYNGFITNCKMPRPWWILRGRKFDVVPNDRAVAYHSVYWLKKAPLFYFPFFRKSLERMPRQSGFLTPSIGNSSRRGKMFGGGYYWAISRSYDAVYRPQYFTQRGFAHTVDFRGKPNESTDFDVYLYGVNDRGEQLPNGERRKQGGALLAIKGHSDLGGGWYSRGEINYLSSIVFRQAFTESVNETIASELHSAGFVSKDWSTFNFDLAGDRVESFLDVSNPKDTIAIRRLPVVNFRSRDHRLFRSLPLWVSWESSAGLLRRQQLLFQTRQFVDRLDLYPRVMTAFDWKGFHFLPSFAVRETHWGESLSDGNVVGRAIERHGREFTLAIIPPSFSRVFDNGKWFGAEKLKHVIEPRLSFRHVAGVDGFDRFVRFDDTELYSNTSEAEFSLTNRLYGKRGGSANEVLTWELWQRLYFDPSFGGAVVPGQRNDVLSAADLTTYAFLDRPRHYSPIVSNLRMSPRNMIGIEWRADYDPLRGRVTNSWITADGRIGQYFVSLGHSIVRRVAIDPAPNGQPQFLTPGANQFRGTIGLGQENRRGWNAAFNAIYDFRVGVLPYATTWITYNTDCCGFSVQYRRFGIGTRNENQFRVALAISNIGSFGTLKKQERMF